MKKNPYLVISEKNSIMSTIKDILFNIFTLNSLSKLLFLDDFVIPYDIKRFIIDIQMKSFVNVKDINRNLLFKELWLHAANIHLINENKFKRRRHKLIKAITNTDFNIEQAKNQLKFKTFAKRIFRVPMNVDIYSNEDFLNCDAYDRLYEKGDFENIVNITRNGERPNIKNFRNLVKVCKNDKKIINGQEVVLHRTKICYFPLKKDQKVVLISDDFHDEKTRVIATAFMAEEVTFDKQLVIIQMDKSFDMNIPENAFMVIPVSQVAIYK
jgi:hypothetical protein